MTSAQIDAQKIRLKRRSLQHIDPDVSNFGAPWENFRQPRFAQRAHEGVSWVMRESASVTHAEQLAKL
jgi:hypothetical protein